MNRYALKAQMFATVKRLSDLEADLAVYFAAEENITGYSVVRQQTVRGSKYLLVRAVLATEKSGIDSMDFVVARAIVRLAATPSWVWLKWVDAEGVQHERVSKASAWTLTETLQSVT